MLALVPQESPKDEPLAHPVASSVELFTAYTGRWPTSLAELTRKPVDVSFWPEGGFWWGKLPEATWKDGVVRCGKMAVPVTPPSRRAIVPPTDRLKRHYTARVQLRLICAAVQAYLRMHGEWPKKIEELGAFPRDPWGKPYVVEFLGGRARVRTEDWERNSVMEGILAEEERCAVGDRRSSPP